MVQQAVTVNRFLAGYARLLTGDIADERLAEQPLPGVNHPGWILGHLAVTSDAVLRLLGQPRALPPEWHRAFGRGSKLTNVRGDYPPKDELLATLETGYDHARRMIEQAPAELLAGPHHGPVFKDELPTVADLATFLLTGHMGVHLGQLSAWRRMIGLPAMF